MLLHFLEGFCCCATMAAVIAGIVLMDYELVPREHIFRGIFEARR